MRRTSSKKNKDRVIEQTLIKFRKLLGTAMLALDFYADPDTYFAIGFFPDPPCGDFIKDFSKVPWYEGDKHKPGKRARQTIKKIEKELGIKSSE